MDHVRNLLLISILLLIIQPGSPVNGAPDQSLPPDGHNKEQFSDGVIEYSQFEGELDTIRQALKVPGMAAAVVEDQQIVWTKGFGYADLENQVEVTAQTPFHLASVTKPIAATLIMQLVGEGLLELDDPITRYGIDVESDGVVLVRHLLTHTSQGIPGDQHIYDGNRYALLGAVIEGAAGKPLAELLSERIFIPAGMTSTAMNPYPSWGFNPAAGWESFKSHVGYGDAYTRTPHVYQTLARPYQFDESFKITEGSYPLVSSPAAGLMASVEDMARFDIALDQNELLPEGGKAQMFTPAISTYEDSEALQYGLGWYVQNYKGTQLLWHAGRWPPSVSALYMKVPELQLTFIVLGNTANLSTPYDCLGNGDVLCSTLALSFYKNVVFPEVTGKSIPEIDWQTDRADLVNQLREIDDAEVREILERELLSYRQVYASVGEWETSSKLDAVHRTVFGFTPLRKTGYLFSLNQRTPEPVLVAKGVWDYLLVYRATLIWVGLTVLSILVMVWVLVRRKEVSIRYKISWLLAALVFGMFALAGYLIVNKKPGEMAGIEEDLPPWKSAIWRTMTRAALYALWNAFAIQIMLYTMPEEPNPVIIVTMTYLLPLLLSGFVFNGLIIGSETGKNHLEAVRSSLLYEILSVTVMYLVMFPAVLLLMDAWIPGNGALANPVFVLVISLAAAASALVHYPLSIWFANKGLLSWLECLFASDERATSQSTALNNESAWESKSFEGELR